MAAGILDDYHIDDLDADRPITRFMAREFGYVRDEVLQSYPWHVAQARASLAASADAPAFGWTYAYVLPTDCLFLHPLRKDGLIDAPAIPYELEQGRVLTNESAPLLVRYTTRLTAISRWRPLMARALAARLAMYAATRVTGKMQYFEKAQSEYQRIFFEATSADSRERGGAERYGTEFSPASDVFTARGMVY